MASVEVGVNNASEHAESDGSGNAAGEALEPGEIVEDGVVGRESGGEMGGLRCENAGEASSGRGAENENSGNSAQRTLGGEGRTVGKLGEPAAACQAYECFLGDENGASSDMEIEEDISGPSAVQPVSRIPWRNAIATRDNGALAVTLSRNAERAHMEPTLKRKRLTDLATNPIVEVSYEGLTRESKKKLQEALHHWSHWHSQRYSSCRESSKEFLEGGTDVYSPALYVEVGVANTSSNSVSVWMDRPLKQGQSFRGTENVIPSESQEKEEEVPLYDRACISALSSQDSADRSDGIICIEPEEATRCFNCGAYSHSLRDCPRPRDMAAINNARKMHLGKKGILTRSRPPVRYYQTSQGGKFDDLKPGLLGPETRHSLGIGELDPPPWLNRMRELGYPPGYIEDTDDETLEVEIIGEDSEDGEKGQAEDGEIVEKSKSATHEPSLGRKMTVEFPGINAPIPENADKKLWGSPSNGPSVQRPGGTKRYFHQMTHAATNTGGGSRYGLLSSNFSGHSCQGNDSHLRDSHSFDSNPRTRSDGTGASIVCPWTSRSTSISGSNDPVDAWVKRRATGMGPKPDGEHSTKSRSGIREILHTLPSPTGLASPLRGLFRTPGLAEHPPASSAHIYSRHSHFHSKPPQMSLLPTPPTPNNAWLKAQAALGVLQSNLKSGGLMSQNQQRGRR